MEVGAEKTQGEAVAVRQGKPAEWAVPDSCVADKNQKGHLGSQRS